MVYAVPDMLTKGNYTIGWSQLIVSWKVRQIRIVCRNQFCKFCEGIFIV